MFGLFKSKPLYRVAPRPRGRWGIDRLMGAGLTLIYMPMIDTYETEEDANKDMAHLSRTNKSNNAE